MYVKLQNNTVLIVMITEMQYFVALTFKKLCYNINYPVY